MLRNIGAHAARAVAKKNAPRVARAAQVATARPVMARGVASSRARLAAEKVSFSHPSR